jgi:hypothetical protein
MAEPLARTALGCSTAWNRTSLLVSLEGWLSQTQTITLVWNLIGDTLGKFNTMFTGKGRNAIDYDVAAARCRNP